MAGVLDPREEQEFKIKKYGRNPLICQSLEEWELQIKAGFGKIESPPDGFCVITEEYLRAIALRTQEMYSSYTYGSGHRMTWHDSWQILERGRVSPRMEVKLLLE